MKHKGFWWVVQIGVLALASVGALAQTSHPEHFSGTINDNTPATGVSGPWQMNGTWSLDLSNASTKATFSAALTMGRSDVGVMLNGAPGGGSLDVPAQRNAHTHHMVVEGAVTPIPNGFELTGPITITGNGKYPPPFGTPSTATIDIVGGNSVTFSNIQITLAGAATTHFGTQPINGVVRSVK